MTTDLMMIQEILLDEQYANQRLDKVIAQLFPDFSRVFLQNAIKNGDILVNSQQQAPKYIVKGNEMLTVKLISLDNGSLWEPEPVALNIVYEDDDVIVINKPIGLVVHPAAGNWQGTLVNGLLYHCPALKALPRAGIVHRLDKDTSGLLVVAKNRLAHHHLVDQLQQHLVKRQYQALVYGDIVAGNTIEGNIGRSGRDRQKMALVAVGGKHAVTHYRISERFDGFTLLNVELETGRTHQIRVHLASIHHPIVGDTVYGKGLKFPKNANNELKEVLRSFSHQALHAKKLGFTHPKSGEWVSFSSHLPEDFEHLLDLLRVHRDHEADY